jgi:hypothetical protein
MPETLEVTLEVILEVKLPAATVIQEDLAAVKAMAAEPQHNFD